jgi:protocatechuate 3,4-dioxygenase beta subunit
MMRRAHSAHISEGVTGMSFSVRYLPAVLLLVLSLPPSLCAQSTVKQTTKTSRGSISGRITIKEKAAAGVVVSLRQRDVTVNLFEPAQRATTDQDGFYRITNVAPGSYDVLPSAPAYVMEEAKTSKTKNVLVGEDENVENIDFALVRGGVVTGRVTDVEGRPVIRQQVSIYPADAFNEQSQQRPAFPVSGAYTDDRGIYRVYGLVPGRYKVAAGRSEDGSSTAFGTTRLIYKQVFYPDVSEHSKATVIEVSEGSEASNIDITLGRSIQTFSVGGRFIDGETGLPVPNVRVGIQRGTAQRIEYVNTFAATDAQGDFTIEGLIPGKYAIFLVPNQRPGMRVETVSFDIVDQDVSGLTLKLIKGASVSGLVVLETEDKAALQRLSQLQLRAFVMSRNEGGGLGSSGTSPISPDGSFSLKGLPGGLLNINLSSMTNAYPPPGFSIVRVERDGVAARQRSLPIKDGEQITNVRVVVSYGSASIRGVVKIENGVLPEGARLFVRLFKAGEKPGESLSNLRPPQVDARGHFLIEGIPSGTYEVVASVGGAVPPPPRMVKRDVTVQDGTTTDVTLTIDMSAPLKP